MKLFKLGQMDQSPYKWERSQLEWTFAALTLTQIIHKKRTSSKSTKDKDTYINNIYT